MIGKFNKIKLKLIRLSLCFKGCPNMVNKSPTNKLLQLLIFKLSQSQNIIQILSVYFHLYISNLFLLDPKRAEVLVAKRRKKKKEKIIIDGQNFLVNWFGDKYKSYEYKIDMWLKVHVASLLTLLLLHSKMFFEKCWTFLGVCLLVKCGQ